MAEIQLRLFLGDPYLCDRALATRDAALRATDPQIERHVLFGDDIDPAALAAEIPARSLFSFGRHFVIRRVDAGRAGAGLAQALDQPIPTGTYVSLLAGSLRANHPVAKLLKGDEQAVVSLPTPKGTSLQRMARDMIKSSGLSLSSPSARFLSTSCGQDLMSLSQELDKLRAYSGGHPLPDDAAQQLCFNHAEATVYPFYDRLGEGQLSASLEELANLREDAGRIVSGIIRHFTRLTMIRLLIDQRVPPAEIAAKTGLQAWLCRRLIEQTRERSLDALSGVLRAGLQCDQRIKQGKVSPADALMQLILTASGATAGL